MDIVVGHLIIYCPRRRQSHGRVMSGRMCLFVFVGLCICLFFHMIFQIPMQLGAPNLTHILETHLFSGQNVKGQGHTTHKKHVCVGLQNE